MAREEVFEAGVQYDDWKGDAAADDTMPGSFREILEQRRLLGDGDFLVGIKLYLGEGGGHGHFPPQIEAISILANNAEEAQRFLTSQSNEIKVKRTIVELSNEEFFRCFKRFSIALAWRETGILGRILSSEE